MIFFAVEIFYLTQTVRPVKSLEARFKRTQTVHSTVYVVTISEGIVSVKKSALPFLLSCCLISER